MRRARLTLAAALTAVSAQAQNPPADDAASGESYVAVVIGLNSYEHLPDDAELDFARSDAATVAGALKEHGGFDVSFLLTDRDANRESIRETLRTKVAQLVGPKDTLLVYFVGHGLGADLGIPTLLAHDSTLENGQEDGFEVGAFARDISTWTRAGRTILVTDAIHKNQLDGIPFYGPSADQWPGLGPNTLVVSSSSAGEPARDGSFGPPFADALSGAADADADTVITAKELMDYLNTRMTGSGQTPSFAGNYEPDMAIARGVKPGTTAEGDLPAADAAVYGEHEVYAAKFVFRDGAAATVTCRDGGTKACDNTCYVRNFRAGPCQLTALVDDKEIRGVTLALLPGLYQCDVRAGHKLGCVPPAPPDQGGAR
jgi:hypothetical protein